MIIKNGEQILTVIEAPSEDDAFRYYINYNSDIIFNRGEKITPNEKSISS